MLFIQHRHIHLILFILLGALLSACTLSGVSAQPVPVQVSLNQPVIYQVPADATATATPFQPLPPTATFLPTPIPPTATPVPSATPLPTNTPVPTATPTQKLVQHKYPKPNAWSPISIPSPVGRLRQPEGQLNFLLLGSDLRPYSNIYRTDTILLLTVNPKLGKINLTSFPRDLYVYIPGWTMQRVNTAMAHGGFETLALTFEYNFGVYPDGYVMVNFGSFVNIVDSLGGVDVNVGTTLSDYRGSAWYTVPAGVVHMNGQTALWYSRSRKSTSDFERTQRQQEVMQAIFDKLLSMNAIKKVPELYKEFKNSVTTDLSLNDLLALLPLADDLDDSGTIHNYFISRKEVNGWVTPDGAQVLLPKREAVLEVMRQALNLP